MTIGGQDRPKPGGETVKLWAGTSGYSYKEWKGSFYPRDLPAKDMLAEYARRLPAVEINNTFYRMPTVELLASWAEQVPESFRFVLKASRRITHLKRLAGCEEETAYLFETARALGARLGAVLFQLPPYLKKDLPRLREFLGLIPGSARAAFEFRHESWFEPEIYDSLRERGCALGFADSEDSKLEDLVATASWGYLRLRKPDYDEKELRGWLGKVRRQAWEEAFVFFKHEDGGTGPALARRLLELAAEGRSLSRVSKTGDPPI